MELVRNTEHNIDTTEFGLARIWEEQSRLPRVTPFRLALHHIRRSYESFKASPFTSIVSVVTISISLFLLGAFLLFFQNVRNVASKSRSDLSISIYLREGVSQARVSELSRIAKESAEVSSVSYKSKDEALKSFSLALGAQSGLLDGLGVSNPLPASLEVTLREGLDNAAYRGFADRFKAHAEVEAVHFSEELLSKLGVLLNLFRVGGIAAIIFMLIVTGFIMANTIKLALYAHRQEIEIMRLVGGTSYFIKAPYLIEGFFQGLIGSIISLTALFLIFHLSLQSDFKILDFNLNDLRFLAAGDLVLVVAAGIGIGLIGSYMALREFDE